MEPLNRYVYDRYVNGLEDGFKMKVSIEPYYRKMDNSQRSLFYFYCRLISDFNGDDVFSVSEALKLKFGIYRPMKKKDGSEVTDLSGNLVLVCKDLEDYNTKEMSELLNKVHSFCVFDLGIKVPEKKELSKLNF